MEFFSVHVFVCVFQSVRLVLSVGWHTSWGIGISIGKVLYVWTGMRSHLKFSAGVADLIDVGQRASVVLRPSLRQTKLLDLLKLHLSVKRTTRTNTRLSGFMNYGHGQNTELQNENYNLCRLGLFFRTTVIVPHIPNIKPRDQLSGSIINIFC